MTTSRLTHPLPVLTESQTERLKKRPLAAILVVEQRISVEQALALSPDELARLVLPLPERPADGFEAVSVANNMLSNPDEVAVARLMAEHLAMHAAEVLMLNQERDGRGFRGKITVPKAWGVFAKLMDNAESPGGRVASNMANGVNDRKVFAFRLLTGESYCP